METENILDVTGIEPRLKHPTIFKKFDSLRPAEFFILFNDHDPKPLYYQLLGERGQTFSWEYLESGPEVWRVKLGRPGAEDTGEETIGDMVRKDYRKAQVFKKLGIDFCCGGKKTLAEVSAKKGISAEKILEELAALEQSEASGSGLNFDKWEIDFLAEYITNTHHGYARENIPFISELAAKVASVHGEHHPELIAVANAFARIAQDLSLHMVKEERILFPFIKELVQLRKSGGKLQERPIGPVANPIRVMEMEHEQVGEDLEEIRTLTGNYALPADACSSYTILFKKLEEFGDDLHKHVHLENNILFPKAILLEKELK